MSIDDPYGVESFHRGQRLTSAEMNNLRKSSAGNFLSRSAGMRARNTPSGTMAMPYSRSRSAAAGSTMEIIKQLNPSEPNGAIIDPFTQSVTEHDSQQKLELLLPWGDLWEPPAGFISLAYQVTNEDSTETKWIGHLGDRFFVKPSVPIPATGEFDDDQYVIQLSANPNNTDSISLVGTGIVAVFENVPNNAQVQGYFNNKPFPAGYDLTQNKIYFYHPVF